MAAAVVRNRSTRIRRSAGHRAAPSHSVVHPALSRASYLILREECAERPAPTKSGRLREPRRRRGLACPAAARVAQRVCAHARRRYHAFAASALSDLSRCLSYPAWSSYFGIFSRPDGWLSTTHLSFWTRRPAACDAGVSGRQRCSLTFDSMCKLMATNRVCPRPCRLLCSSCASVTSSGNRRGRARAVNLARAQPGCGCLFARYRSWTCCGRPDRRVCYQISGHSGTSRAPNCLCGVWNLCSSSLCGTSNQERSQADTEHGPVFGKRQQPQFTHQPQKKCLVRTACGPLDRLDDQLVSYPCGGHIRPVCHALFGLRSVTYKWLSGTASLVMPHVLVTLNRHQ